MSIENTCPGGSIEILVLVDSNKKKLKSILYSELHRWYWYEGKCNSNFYNLTFIAFEINVEPDKNAIFKKQS